MAIYQRGKAYYYDFVYKGQRYTGNIGPVSRTVAKEELARRKAEIIEGRLNPAKMRKSPRFEEFTHEYMGWLRTNKKPQSVVRAEAALKHLLPFFGQKKLNDCTSWHIEQYKKGRKEKGSAPATINIELTFLKAMLRKAHAWGQIFDTPSVQLLTHPLGKTRFLSEEEEAALIAAASPALRRIIQTGLLTGFRRQELVTLRPEDVDLDRNLVTVAACYAKNGESRTLPMGERLKAVLQEALATQRKAPTVFVTRAGKPWSPIGLTHMFQYSCGRAGIEVLSPHVLRHTFASRLLMAGVDLRTVQELMGHKSITMTIRYAHLSPDHKRAAVEALENRFSGKSPINFHNTPPSALSLNYAKVTAIR